MSVWNVNIGTIFPNVFPGTLGVSCLGKSHGKQWNLFVQDLRNYTKDKHKTIDDTPFGGGPGMVMKCDVLDAWLHESYNHANNSESNAEKNDKYKEIRNRGKIIYMSPRGRAFNQSYASELIKTDLHILCGRYEGVDSRLLKHWEIEEVSMGDYILCGGEVAAMTLVETCVRLIPGVLGNPQSIESDTFSNGLLEHDQYTRPDIWVPKDSKMEYNTPCVLKSGNHKEISSWRQSNSETLTKNRRSDLWVEYIRKKEKNVHS
ncbi:tRNA (guanosine(37)-N1)-methyltransferase TrmD [Candidatus Cytomitobacter primus]|uniref:tRNA (guanine-N(1)-)-methyltransferase n=1 Tax=Candidatus Cytomitobacter primus TaxID=2066024 RepID=A0A5C0UG92_9PROT|nr:tRNA (guanosine(37)-N1)-methyltransferase TrmD [Candidatus Cytomitobacter primus]QEK38747.1 tRNA (guanosine(37)-N1)-methyltransferase TrmD [Candidatus Cytomitobacter primus]